MRRNIITLYLLTGVTLCVSGVVFGSAMLLVVGMFLMVSTVWMVG